VKENHTSLQVNIFGSQYTIKGVAQPDYINELAAYVDSKMREITQNTATISSTKVAILAALNIADELHQAQREMKTDQNLLSQKADHIMSLINKELNK